jgi:hypothetical protein
LVLINGHLDVINRGPIVTAQSTQGLTVVVGSPGDSTS